MYNMEKLKERKKDIWNHWCALSPSLVREIDKIDLDQALQAVNADRNSTDQYNLSNIVRYRPRFSANIRVPAKCKIFGRNLSPIPHPLISAQWHMMFGLIRIASPCQAVLMRPHNTCFNKKYVYSTILCKSKLQIKDNMLTKQQWSRSRLISLLSATGNINIWNEQAGRYISKVL